VVQIAAAAKLQHCVHLLLAGDAYTQQLHHARVVCQRHVQRLPHEGLPQLRGAQAGKGRARVRHVERLDRHGFAGQRPAVHDAERTLAEVVVLEAVAQRVERQPQALQHGWQLQRQRRSCRDGRRFRLHRGPL
jgi:hypothetical protein